MNKTAAVVLAGGRGERIGGPVPKQYLELAGKPMLWHTLKAFEASVVDEVILVVPKGGVDYAREQYVEKYGFRKIAAVVEGGAERYDSVYAGLNALRDRGCRIVAIHDGARPLVTPELILQSVHTAEAHGACVIAVPVKDTIKLADAEGFAAETLPRNRLWAMQTPQTFRYDICIRAFDRMMEREGGREGITDDAMVIEKYSSIQVKFSMGDYRNIKVTTREDLITAEAFLKNV